MKKRVHFTTTQTIMLSFLFGILIGSILLALPISSSTQGKIDYIDALFTATTSMCVTGLVTLPTVSTWSFFGQLVILILIQIGGLGVITIIAGLMIYMNKKIGLNDRLLLQDAFNLNSISGIIRFIKKVLKGTLIVESVGALLYMLVFVPEFGVRGIWISIFTSVSAFCNAGIDIISENSLCDYALNPIVNAVTSMLIVLGGIGYLVWWDVVRVLKKRTQQKISVFSHLTLHSKIVLSVTTFLVLFGALSFLVFEYNNPLTIKNLSLFDKVQVSFFQSITTRTAGFATIPQQNLTNSSAIISMILMFIGGSPAGTAGGIKTITIAVLLISALATIQNREHVEVFDRTLSKHAVNKSVAVVSVSFSIMMVSTLLLSSCMHADLLDILYETVSATATVGLTRNLTPSLNMMGKIVIIVTMYLGRVGPISLLVAFNAKKDKKNVIKNPIEEISIG
ncbi:MAG: potassium uptake protein [Erysipelotrichaceae bacterium]|nr:potassium uptake protein [Erysipelotrichaceae bacterium]